MLAQNPTFHKQSPYDPIADFAHVALFSDSARVLIARKDFPPNDFKEFMAYVKATPEHAAIRLARRGLGRRTPARSCSTARWAPRSPMCPIAAPAPRCRTCSAAASTTWLEQISTATPQIKAGAVKAYATLGLDRGPGLENIPTAEELGVKGLDCGAWGSFSFPKDTPQAIVQRLAKASSDAIDTPAVIERYKAIGVVVTAKDRRSPEYLTKFVKSEIARWAEPIKASGVTLD